MVDPIATDAALDEIATRLEAIRQEHGPESIAVFAGNGATFKTTLLPTAHAWLEGPGVAPVLFLADHRPAGQGHRRRPGRVVGRRHPRLRLVRRGDDDRQQRRRLQPQRARRSSGMAAQGDP